jgi:hypothetical protein
VDIGGGFSSLKTGLIILGIGAILLITASTGVAVRLARSISEGWPHPTEARVISAPLILSSSAQASIQEASNLFLKGLRNEAQVRLGEQTQLDWVDSEWVGNRLAAFSIAVASSSTTTGGGRWCDDHGDVSALDDYFRPDAPPYHRCREHHPPHCYDDSSPPQRIPCP